MPIQCCFFWILVGPHLIIRIHTRLRETATIFFLGCLTLTFRNRTSISRLASIPILWRNGISTEHTRHSILEASLNCSCYYRVRSIINILYRLPLHLLQTLRPQSLGISWIENEDLVCLLWHHLPTPLLCNRLAITRLFRLSNHLGCSLNLNVHSAFDGCVPTFWSHSTSLGKSNLTVLQSRLCIILWNSGFLIIRHRRAVSESRAIASSL